MSVVTEDWRWRMVTPPKGDYISIPLSDEGRRVAFQWDPATDGSCKAFGAAGLMRIPTRLNITWQGDDVLKVESDAGQQTRLLQFAPKSGPGARSLQGFSRPQRVAPRGLSSAARTAAPMRSPRRAGWACTGRREADSRNCEESTRLSRRRRCTRPV